MSESNHDRLERLFVAALDRAPDERTAFLDTACGEDSFLRDRVASLLDDHGRADAFMRVADDAVEPSRDPIEGQRVGRYRIDRILAVGGMGTVYVATQDEPQREVALKVMRSGIASRTALRRFQLEAQVLGRLRHPNIAQVYEAGTHDDGGGGTPYFAMEYVAGGQPLTAYAEATKLGTRERLAMFATVCEAVHHGHQKGVIHRDLKPSNILVDGSGEPKIIDFGVARATDSDIALTTLGTDLGQLVGTLAYMSPEQCAADPDDLDTRSDVYALGVVLYELLCGHLPYDLSRVPFPEAARVIREETPARPSTADRTLRGDIETIALKTLEKDRERRYQSAADLGQDVDRYLRGEAIDARPPSTAYRVRTFARRHKVATAVLAMLLVAVPLLAAATVVAATSAVRALDAQRDAQAAQGAAEAAQREAEVEQHKAESITKLVIDSLVASDPLQGGRHDYLVVAAMAQVIAELDGGALQDQPETEVDLRMTISKVLSGNWRHAEALEQAERALEINRSLHPGDHREVARSLHAVARDLRRLDRRDEAVTVWEEMLAMLQRLHPGDHEALAWGYYLLAQGLDAADRFEESLTMMRAALEMRQRLSRGDDPGVAAAMSELALTLKAMGREAEALSLAEQAAAMNRRLTGGADSLDRAYDLTLIGGCLRHLGWPERALVKLRAGHEMMERLPAGPGHQTGDWSKRALAGCLVTLGRADEALPLYRQSLERLEGHLPDSADSPSMTGAHGGLARCLLALDQPDAALTHAQYVIDRDRRRGRDHTRGSAQNLTVYASCLAAMDRPEEALPAYEEAMEIYRRVLPSDHPGPVGAQIDMARTLVMLARYDEAEALLLDAAGHCDRSDVARRWHGRTVAEEAVRLYEEWHASEPDRGPPPAGG